MCSHFFIMFYVSPPFLVDDALKRQVIYLLSYPIYNNRTGPYHSENGTDKKHNTCHSLLILKFSLTAILKDSSSHYGSRSVTLLRLCNFSCPLISIVPVPNLCFEYWGTYFLQDLYTPTSWFLSMVNWELKNCFRSWIFSHI